MHTNSEPEGQYRARGRIALGPADAGQARRAPKVRSLENLISQPLGELYKSRGSVLPPTFCTNKRLNI